MFLLATAAPAPMQPHRGTRPLRLPAGAPSEPIRSLRVSQEGDEEDRLPLQNLRMRLVDPKPFGAVKFRKCLPPSSTRLLCLAERHGLFARLVTRLFRELPLCGGKRLSVIRPFGIDHDARSLVAPEGPPG
jgi:hypothetical protein